MSPDGAGRIVCDDRHDVPDQSTACVPFDEQEPVKRRNTEARVVTFPSFSGQYIGLTSRTGPYLVYLRKILPSLGIMLPIMSIRFHCDSTNEERHTAGAS